MQFHQTFVALVRTYRAPTLSLTKPDQTIEVFLDASDEAEAITILARAYPDATVLDCVPFN